jgi:Ni,Fe-hydrogenase III large subunit/Ni,Fe-hydrogenase III component G
MVEINEAVRSLRAIFGTGIRGVDRVREIPVVTADKRDIPAIAWHIHHTPDWQGELSLQWAVDLRPLQSAYRIYYLFTLGKGGWLILQTELNAEDRFFPSITPRIHAAKWYEREIRDMLGLIAEGHPDLRRLVRHEHWPTGTHPLRKDFAWNRVLSRQGGEFHFRQIEGEGVLEVPVGPIHAGIIEPGHFRFSVAGEPIMQLEVRLFWKHRGVEKLFENLAWPKGMALAERVSGDTTFAHGLCYCQAVEVLHGIRVPARAEYLRTIFLELERLHNHIGDIGAICNDVAYSLALAHCGRMKERVMQLNDELTGSRFLRGTNVIGGTSVDLSQEGVKKIESVLEEIQPDFSNLAQILFRNASLTDRLETTGVLIERTARDHAVMGVVGRASNIDRDVRRDRPFAAYDRLQFKVPVYRYGDVRARLRVRIDEVHESIGLIRQALQNLPGGSISAAIPPEPRPGDWALSAVEGWRGEILYFVMAGEEGKIHRCKVRDPSFVIWPAIQFAALGNIIPDFPVINKSFNLSYAGTDL